MRAVNLLQSDGGRAGERAPRLTTRSVAIGGGVLLAAACVLFGVLAVGARNNVSDRQKTLATVHKQVADAEAKARESASTSATPADDQARLAAFTAAASTRISWDDLLFDLARVLPPGSWVSGLTMHAPVAVAPAPVGTDSTVTAAPAQVGDPTSFVISGYALTSNTVARVMERLALVPMLSEVSLQSSTRATVGSRSAFQFAMNAVLRSPGESAGAQ